MDLRLETPIIIRATYKYNKIPKFLPCFPNKPFRISCSFMITEINIKAGIDIGKNRNLLLILNKFGLINTIIETENINARSLGNSTPSINDGTKMKYKNPGSR